MDHRDVRTQAFHFDATYAEGGLSKDDFESVLVRFVDGLPVAPPKANDVHEIRIFVEDRGELPRITPIPRLREHPRDLLGIVQFRVVGL